MIDWEWRWFSGHIWKKNAWGFGAEFALQKDYSYVTAFILRWELNLQWEKDYAYAR